MSRAAARAVSFGGACALVLALVACEEDGKTAPSFCPELPLYDITDDAEANAAGRPAILQEAASKGCITAAGHATSPGPARGAGGAESGGEAGRDGG